MLKHLIKCSLLLALLAGSLPAAEMPLPRYSVHDLLRAEGGEARPFSINNRGQVAAMNRTNGQYRAYLFADGAWTNLGTLGGGYSKGSGIGPSGMVAGTSTNGSNQRRGFIWTPGGTNGVTGNPQMRELPTLGGTVSEAFGVNSAGQVAGMAATATRQQAALFNTNTVVNIGALIQSSWGLPWSYGYGINEQGDVAGEAYNSNFTAWQAFLYRDGGITNIGHLGGNNATAFAVNTNRKVCGYSVNADGFDRAFRWQVGVMQDLGTLGGAVSYGFAINSMGHVVGASDIDGSYTNSRAFIALADTMIDLNTLTDDSGTNWVLMEARGINDLGQIVGLGRRDTSIRFFLLNPYPVVEGAGLSGNDVLISFDAIQGGTYRVDSATNLVGETWSPGSMVVTGAGRRVVTTSAIEHNLQFYRVRRVSP